MGKSDALSVTVLTPLPIYPILKIETIRGYTGYGEFKVYPEGEQVQYRDPGGDSVYYTIIVKNTQSFAGPCHLSSDRTDTTSVHHELNRNFAALESFLWRVPEFFGDSCTGENYLRKFSVGHFVDTSLIIDDVKTNNELPKAIPRNYSILIDSSPAGKLITVTGPAGTITVLTPQTVVLTQFDGTAYTIDADPLRFEHWEDGSINPSRTYIPTADATIFATYTPIIRYQLIIDSSPQGKSAQIDGSTGATPWTLKVSPGTYTVKMDSVNFKKWENDELSPTRTISVSADMTITAYYSGVPPSGCFIATAAYGTILAPQLHILRRFRDTCLPKSLTLTYYRLSPPIAEVVKQHQRTLGAIVRKLVEVFIKIFYPSNRNIL